MGCASSTVRWSTNVSGAGIPVGGEGRFHIAEGQGVSADSSASQNSCSDDDIAIVGIGCRTPGADNIRDFWRVLQNGECHISDVPSDRWNAASYLDPDPGAPGKAYVQKGGFITDLHGFDNGLYRINDFEASQMDPQQCQLLECTTMALQDAGLTSTHLQHSCTGVYIGSMNSDYAFRFTGKGSKADSYTTTGVSNTILASRLSYIFDLRGPCMVLNTACSASLIAVHQGCQAIRSGDCDMAICGGVNCMLIPDMFDKLSKARMISPTGLCHTFSDKADGYTRGEGCGIVILKRLKDAIRDGDTIRAQVFTGTNQDGHAVTPMTAPSGEQQKKLLHSVYDKFQVDVSQLDYIEAHGTGTPAGDPVEVNALGSFFQERGPPRQRHIGSVKTNIGHTESAAGVLGLIKVLLMMEHDFIVPSLHCQTVNPKIDLSAHSFSIPQHPVPWTGPHKLAACNSFGFGGSNAHAVVKSYMPKHDSKQQQPPQRQKSRCIVCFSGNSQKGLRSSLEDFYNDEEAGLLDVHDISYTSTARREHRPYRAAFLVEDMDDLMATLGEQLSRDKWALSEARPLHVVLVFCGMGTAWDGMCRQLLEDCPVFKEAVLEVEQQLSAFVSWSLTERLQQEDPSKDAVLGPLAIFACQVGLAAVWRSLGVKPGCVVGQSIGEIAAAYTAGCLSLSDAVKILYHRSQLLAEVSGGAMMVVLNVEVSMVRQVVEGFKGKASISLEYSPKACAISADHDTMVSLRPQLVSQLRSTHINMKLVDLDVKVAYHSAHVNAAAKKLEKLINGVTPGVPQVLFLSTVTGHSVTDPVQYGHWVDNVKKPVLFRQAIVESVSSKTHTSTVFLEVGPKPVLPAHMQDLFPKEQHKTLPSITVQSEMKCLHQSIVALYELGLDIDWRNLPTHGNKVTAVPRYSFDKKHLVETTEQEFQLTSGCDLYRKNHLYIYPAEESAESFRVLLSPLTIASVYQHVVMGSIVVPGALYAECGLVVARNVYSHTNVSMSVEFQQLLPLKKDEVTSLEIVPTDSPPKATGKQFVIKRRERTLAAVQVRETKRKHELVNLNTIRSKCTEEVNKASIYSVLKMVGFEFGPAFSMLTHAYISSSECLARLELHDTVVSEMAGTVVHPCIVDSLLQATIFVQANKEIAAKKMLPKSINGLVVVGPMERVMYVHVRLKFSSSSVALFEIQLLSADGRVIGEVTDFTIQALNSQEDKTFPSMLNVYWDKVKDFSLQRLSEEPQDYQKNLLLISKHKLIGGSNYVSHLPYNSTNRAQDYRKELESLLNTRAMEALVVIISLDDYATKGADATQSQLINFCLLIQSVIIILNERSLHIPVFMVTFNAWPCPTGSEDRDVNPTETALYGLLRTVIDEHAYSDIVAVELHIAAGDLNCQTLQKLVDILLTDEDMAHYPEVLITDSSIYVSQVAPLNLSSLSQPERRQNLPTKMTDLAAGAVVLSKEASKVHTLSAISQETKPVSKTHQVLKSHTFALPPEDLFSAKLSSAHLFPDQTGRSTDCVVMALEVTGHSLEVPGQELTSCGPMLVTPEPSISVETTLSTASLPDYQPGDLCKLMIFWSMVERVPTKSFSVLASRDTEHLAELVKLLSCSASERNKTDINVILIDDMKDKVTCHQTVLSLVFLDVDTMSVIARSWEDACSLVSLAYLVTTDLHAYLACVLPDTQLCLLDTHLMFQQSHLKTVVPSIKEWIRKDKSLMSSVSQHLHDTRGSDYSRGIHDLLQFSSLNLPTLSVQVLSDKLFRKDGTYIVVGGLTGLGWLCVQFLAQNNAGFIAIVNRRVPSPERMADMENLAHQFSCKIQSFQGDVSSMKSLEDILKIVSDEWSQKGGLRGVFTGAAVTQDSYFLGMEWSSFENVLSPKVQGTWNLHQVTKDMSLDYFVMHSSVASVLGNLGQANYSTGNAFLDGLAFHRRYLGLAAQTINWGPLDTGILDNQTTIKQKLDSMGFLLASKQEIGETLSVLMKLNWTQSVPVGFNKELYARRIQGTGMQPILKRLQHLLAKIPQGEAKGLDQEMESLDKIRFLQPPHRLDTYIDFVQDLTSRVLSVEKARVTREVSLSDLGLDSVTGMMLINLIERSTSFKLSPVSVLGGESTVVSLAQQLDQFAGGMAE